MSRYEQQRKAEKAAYEAGRQEVLAQVREVLQGFTVPPIAAGMSAGTSGRYGRTATAVALRIAEHIGIDLEDKP